MPLHAKWKSDKLLAFAMSEDEWIALKRNPERVYLKMPCCGCRAIPKTSKLGTQYFSHWKKGECTSAPETAEHLALKTIVAKAAQGQGWNVTTERKGETPSGEAWVADVYCTKGKVKIAFEIQWSRQSEDECNRRTEKYKESGVRCAWFTKGSKPSGYAINYVRDLYDLPLFEVTAQGASFKVVRYGVDIADFVSGMLDGELKFLPKQGQDLLVQPRIQQDKCWKCEQSTGVVIGVNYFSADKDYLGGSSFEHEAGFIRKNYSNETLLRFGVGSIKDRYSKTVEHYYLSNGCINCGAIYGNHFLQIEFLHSEYDQPFEYIEVEELTACQQYDLHTHSLEPSWFFRGEKGT
ncbi:competence protein CoiA [Pseudovibrio brasiliensis]|uniref:Competence protein CoiA nuclease-like domain-containing protein n=1 Tax=Pseudovibrio brasiliensis TaxID=1898042 RepID=A0ABX8AZD9_9HYPH|nr:competence protein CoiA family protein [Pseudovibrio brasiliensis]QUS59046.1 hypothetical protein KGB56_25875 [Pseudovibrio brasiliensis]